jgi:uncharacterized protein YdiU (UPF0061 family)
LATVETDNDADDQQLVAPLQAAYYQPEQHTADTIARTAHWLRTYLARVQRAGIGKSERVERMNAVNPKYVLRNYLAQLAIDKSAEGDQSLLHELLDVLRNPYSEQPGKQQFAEKRPEWARNRAGCSMLSCSS